VLEERRQNLFVWVAAALLIAAVGYRLIGAGAPAAAPPVELERPAGEARGGGARGDGRAQAGERLYVHVAGAVRRPGLYRVAAGARIAAALELAGGPRPKADLAAINLAAKAEDGQQILVPLRSAAARAPAAVASGTESGGPISLATATQPQLEELDGIGPVLAQAILEYRDENGGFRSVEELQEVSGIGEVRLEALREAVRP